MLKKSEGLCLSFFHNPQLGKFEPFQKPLLSSFARPFNVFPWNKPKSDKFSENRISKNHRKLGLVQKQCSLSICQGYETPHCWKQKLFWSNLSLGWMRWISPKLTSTKNLLRVVRNLTMCLQCAFWRQEKEISRRSKRRWKVQSLYFLTGR